MKQEISNAHSSQTNYLARTLPKLLLCLICLALPAWAAQPNFVVILVDDAAFTDFGGYGGEANTPNINQLADRGVRFSNYHTSPMCAPSPLSLGQRRVEITVVANLPLPLAIGSPTSGPFVPAGARQLSSVVDDAAASY